MRNLSFLVIGSLLIAGSIKKTRSLITSFVKKAWTRTTAFARGKHLLVVKFIKDHWLWFVAGVFIVAVLYFIITGIADTSIANLFSTPEAVNNSTGSSTATATNSNSGTLSLYELLVALAIFIVSLVVSLVVVGMTGLSGIWKSIVSIALAIFTTYIFYNAVMDHLAATGVDLTPAEVVIDEEIKPSMGGTHVVLMQPGYEYKIYVSGCWEVFTENGNPNSSHVQTCADGTMPNQGNTTWKFKDAIDSSGEPLDRWQNSGMVVIKINGNNFFETQVEYLISTNSSPVKLRLDANVIQANKFYTKSIGMFHVKVTRRKI